MEQKQPPFLGFPPVSFVDVGTQVVPPAFPTLLALSSWETLGDDRPMGWTMGLNQIQQRGVVGLTPDVLVSL